jgi:hypothetical protein
MFRNAELADLAKIINAYGPATPSTADPQAVSLKNYDRATILIAVLNGTTVTGSAITLQQCTAVAGTGAKALGFSTMKSCVDCAAGDTLAVTAVSSNTFTTNTTNSKRLLYAIDIKASDLDVANDFDCIRARAANAANTTLQISYILYPPRYASPAAVSAITD